MPWDETEFAAKVAEAWRGELEFSQLFTYVGLLEAAGQRPLMVVLYRTWLQRNQTKYNPFVLFNLGVALTGEQDFEGAVHAYREAIQLSPTFLQPHINLGLVLERLGDPAAAVAEWRWVVQNANPDLPDHRDLKAQALKHLGRLQEQVTGPFLAPAPEPAPASAPEPPLRVSVILSDPGSDLTEALADLADQSLFRAGELELLVVAGEGEAIRALAADRPRQVRDLRVRIPETPGFGWNRGVEAAQGSYLTLAGAGDRRPPGALERLARALDEEPGIAVVYGDDDLTAGGEGSFATAARSARCAWPDFEPARLFEAGRLGPHPLWRRALHGVHGAFDPGFRFRGDFDFWLRLAGGGERFLHLPEVLGLYRPGPEEDALVAAAEAFLARARHWPRAWGPLPALRGNYQFNLG